MAAHDHDPVDLVLERLRSAGCNPRASGPNSWSAKCPNLDAHKGGDRNPSLSVGSSPTGNALVYCHRGCSVRDVTDALHLTMRDLFPAKPPKVAHIDERGRWKAVYSYYDADGEFCYDVVRFEKADGGKTFRVRSHGPSGEWVWNRGKHPNLLYQLPQVRRAVETGQTILICEGEKDVENANWWWPGAVATCNTHGAGKWDQGHTDAIAGASQVVIVADDDVPGHEHARAVAAALTGKVGDIRACLAHPGQKDLSEHIGAGRTMDDLRWLGPEWLSSEEVELAGTITPLIDWSTIWHQERRPEWLCDPVIAEGRGHAIYAKGGTGKSLIVLSLVAAICTGAAVLNQPGGRKRHVLYLDYEMTEDDLIERMDALGYGPDSDLSHLHYALLPSLPPLDTNEGANAVTQLAQQVGAELVVIDTFGRAVAGEENEADTVRDYYRMTGMSLKAMGIATLRVDHVGKDSERGARGSSAKLDDVDVVWELRRADDGYTLINKKRRMGWISDTVVLKMHDDPLHFTVADAVWPTGTMQTAAHLEAIGVTHTATIAMAKSAMGAAGEMPPLASRRQQVVSAALRYMRSKAAHQDIEIFGNSVGNSSYPQPPEQCREQSSNMPSDRGGNNAGTARNSPRSPTGTVPPLKGEQSPDPVLNAVASTSVRTSLDDLDW